MPTCKVCNAINVRHLLVEAINDGWASPPMPFHPSIRTIRDGSNMGCQLCTWVWEDVEEMIRTVRRWNPKEVDEISYKLEYEDTGSLGISAAGSPSHKATINVNWPWADAIQSYSCISKFQAFRAGGDSHSDDREDVTNLLVRDIDDNTGSEYTLKIAAHWLAKCKAHHPACSASAQGHTERLPTRVIDVGSEIQKPKLVDSGAKVGRWVALSYCWGGNSTFLLTSSSYPKFREGIKLEEFPATLRDAIVITRALQIPYLWIDALCIFQDSFKDWQREAPLMKEIYSGAEIVIAATCANDVNAGIFRARNIEASIKLPWRTKTDVPKAPEIHVGVELKQDESLNQAIFLRRRNLAVFDGPNNIHNSRWESRGWTMQEDFMATRSLVFQDQTVAWECLSKVEEEDGEARSVADVIQDDANSRDSRNFLTQYWKRVLAASRISEEVAQTFNLTIPSGHYIHLHVMWYVTLQKYSDRRLTKVTDRLSALSGFAILFKQVTGDEYCAGIWKSHLLGGLLWYYIPAREERPRPAEVHAEMLAMDFEELISKIYIYENDHLYLTGTGPSWSWVSLEGTLKSAGFDGPLHLDSNKDATRTSVVDVQVDPISESDPFGQVHSGKLTLSAAYVSWTKGSLHDELQPADANMQKFVAESLASGTELKAEYQLRHQPHEGQITAVLLIGCNEIQGLALLVESVPNSITSGEGNSALLYRRVGRLAMQKSEPWDNAPGNHNYVSPAQMQAYGDCARGLPMMTFIII